MKMSTGCLACHCERNEAIFAFSDSDCFVPPPDKAGQTPAGGYLETRSERAGAKHFVDIERLFNPFDLRPLGGVYTVILP